MAYNNQSKIQLNSKRFATQIARANAAEAAQKSALLKANSRIQEQRKNRTEDTEAAERQ